MGIVHQMHDLHVMVSTCMRIIGHGDYITNARFACYRCEYFVLVLVEGRQGRVPEPTQRAEIRNSIVTDSRHQITAVDGCKVR